MHAAAALVVLAQDASGLLLLAGVPKLASGMAQLVARPRPRPPHGTQRSSHVALVVLASVETAAAVAGFGGIAKLWTAATNTALGLAFVGYQGARRRKVDSADCGCFGSHRLDARTSHGAMMRAGLVLLGGAAGVTAVAVGSPDGGVGSVVAGLVIAAGVVAATGSTPRCHPAIWRARGQRLRLVRAHPIYRELAQAYEFNGSRYVHVRSGCTDEFRFAAESSDGASIVLRVEVSEQGWATVQANVATVTR